MVINRRAALIAVTGMLLPILSQAQSLSDQAKGLYGVLDQIYREMLPLCSKLIGVGQGIAGFAATWYIASRVWRHIAAAEPIDLSAVPAFCDWFCSGHFPLSYQHD